MTKDKKIVGELIYGVHPLLEVLKAKKRKVISIYTTKPVPKAWRDVENLLPARPIPIQYVSPEILTKMAGTDDHQRIVAWVGSTVTRKVFFNPTKHPLLLMLDGIQDVRNLGAILRSAYCTGIDGVIIVKKGSVALNAAALKASAGLAEYLDIFIALSAQAAVQELTNAGYTIYLATLAGTDAAKQQYKKPCCLVIGSEGYGITPSILTHGTEITIAQRNPDISYNASVAAGILLFLISQKAP
jgi:23S rRNA (guanosine2251-2'-O)-methyltransferase